MGYGKHTQNESNKLHLEHFYAYVGLRSRAHHGDIVSKSTISSSSSENSSFIVGSV